ncbi:MAG: TonB-dependent receptor [Acidobacteria bacterium]|nr:TonB-dependent receptor [Acidobacteriota bacterium]
MNKLNIKVLFACIALLVFSAVSMFAQELGQLNGTVKDPNGAVVPGATVTATNASTGVAKTATTNDEGFYTILNLTPGSYNIEVTKTGFATQKATASVAVGGATTENVQLGVQAVVNVVDVAGDSGGVAEVNTTDQQQSNVVTQKQIQNLPILDRNPYSLAATAGNVSTNDPDGRGAGVAINGLRSSSTEILLDGTENAAVFSAGIAQTVPQDSVSEFRIITNNFSAEYGRASGGVVNVVTRSGGNKLEGSAFIQDRRSSLAANSFDNNANNQPKGKFTREQFGGSILGPIVKNKAFFSEFFEGTRVRSTDTVFAWVPTTSYISAMAPNAKAIFTANALRSGATATGATSTVAGCPGCTYALYSFVIPTDAGGGTPTNDWNNAARVDWNLSDNTQINGSWKYAKSNNLIGSRFNSVWDGYDTSITGSSQNFQGAIVHNFSSTFIMDAKVSFNRLKGGNATGGKDPASPTLYLGSSTINVTGSKYPVELPGYLPTLPGVGLDSTEDQKLWDIKPNATWIKGDHNIRFGGQYVNIADKVLFPAYQNASENLGSTLGSGSLALLGGTNGCPVGQACARQFQVALDPQGKFPGGSVTRPATSPSFQRDNLYKEFALYANDQWRAVPHLTLNLGVRYEYFGPQHSKEGLDSNFFFGSGSTRAQQIRNGRLQTTGTSGLWKADKNNFAPRLGFAWDVFGDGKTSVRGGYGIAYERNFGNVTFNVIQNPPYYAVLGDANVPVSANNFGNFGVAGPPITLSRVTLRAVDPNIVNASASQWGLSVEHELSPGTVVKVEYSGSRGKNLYSITNINRVGSGQQYLGSYSTPGVDCPSTLSSAFLSISRLNCNYGNINFRGSDGRSSYYGITTSLESLNLFHTGIAFTGRYTYSNSKDDLSATFGGNSGNLGLTLGYLDPFNPMLDWGPSDYDTRHRFIATAIYQIPFKFDNKAINAVLGDWNIATIVNIQSGPPFSIFDFTTGFGVAMRMERNAPGGGPNPLTFNHTNVLIGPNTYNFIDLSGVTPSNFVGADSANLSAAAGFPCCSDNGPYPADMSTRNAFRAPGFWNADMSLYKNIHITERYKVQLRADAFDVTNHANTFVDYGSADVSSSSSVNAFKAGNRRIQLSAKFFF